MHYSENNTSIPLRLTLTGEETDSDIYYEDLQ